MHVSTRPRRWFVGAALALSALTTAALPSVAGAQTSPPTVQYAPVPVGPGTLTVMNAPEVLTAAGDANRDMIHRGSLQPGSHRVWWEHGNYQDPTFTYGVLLHNTSGCALRLVVDARSTGSFGPSGVNGGKVLADLRNRVGAGTPAVSLPAGSAVWLSTQSVPRGFFSGAVDFRVERVGCTTGGAFFIKSGVFSPLPTPASAASLPYRGAQSGVNGNDTKVYNGFVTVPGNLSAPAAGVGTQNLVFDVSGATPRNTPLPVLVKGAQQTSWITNSTPDRQQTPQNGPRVVGNDMLSVWMPLSPTSTALTEISPFADDPRSPDTLSGNLANYGVESRAIVRVRNTGAPTTVRITYRQADNTGNVRLALGCGNGAWQSLNWAAAGANDTAVCDFQVGTGDTTVTASHIIGGPSIGAIETSVQLVG